MLLEKLALVLIIKNSIIFADETILTNEHENEYFKEY